jgi:hypothetical protein
MSKNMVQNFRNDGLEQLGDLQGSIPSASQGDQRHAVGQNCLCHEDWKGEEHEEVVKAEDGSDIRLRVIESITVLLNPHHEHYQSRDPQEAWSTPRKSRTNCLHSMPHLSRSHLQGTKQD